MTKVQGDQAQRKQQKMLNIRRKLQAVLDSIKGNDLQGAFEAWKKRRDRCIRSQ
jgi:hypothetical protein